MKDIGLYIHIPFCKSKCYYCDFNSYSNKEIIQDEYISSLIRELDMRSEIIEKSSIKSVYVGGGTPTYLNLRAMDRLLERLEEYRGDNVEYTWEANPGTLTDEKLKLLKSGGVNRLSIGLQSCDNKILKYLGRIHTYEDFIENFHKARELGFNNINVDLMFAIEGQTLNNFKSTLQEVISLNPEHISCYGLIIEEGTPFWKMHERGELKDFDEDADREMYYCAKLTLHDAGYRWYEISNFAKPGYECNHNIIYWKTEDYLGAGTAAHSLIDGRRFSNELSPEKYIEKVKSGTLPVVWHEDLTLKERMSEFMFMGLRMMEGISIDEFRERFGVGMLSVYGREIDRLIKKGLLCFKNGRLFLSDFGVDISNQVFVEFV